MGEWFKSFFTSTHQDLCVEVQFSEDKETVNVRHSHHPEGPMLTYTYGEWEAFIKGVKLGEFDLPCKEVKSA